MGASIPHLGMGIDQFCPTFRSTNFTNVSEKGKEKEDIIWRRKRKIVFGEGKYIFFLAEKKKNIEGKVEKYLEKEVKKN